MERQNKTNNLFKLIVWLFIIGHVVLLALVIKSAHHPLLYAQNIAGICYFLVLLLLNRKKIISLDTSIFATVIVIWIQVFLAYLVLGIRGGFQVYCFATLSASFFILFPSDEKKHHLRKSVVVEMGSVILCMAILISSQFLEPWYVLPPDLLRNLSFVNALAAFVELLFFSDVYRLRMSQSVNRLQKEADLDELTGLLNRHGIRHVFDACNMFWHNNAVPYAVAIFDIDDFKQVNDTYGHAVGDEVLKVVSDKLKFFNQEKSSVCRWGGEEFLVIGQIRDDLTLFYECLEQVAEQISQYEFKTDTGAFFVTVTCGVAVIENDMPVHELIDKADHRLYAGKSAGKNQVRVFD